MWGAKDNEDDGIEVTKIRTRAVLPMGNGVGMHPMAFLKTRHSFGPCVCVCVREGAGVCGGLGYGTSGAHASRW